MSSLCIDLYLGSTGHSAWPQLAISALLSSCIVCLFVLKHLMAKKSRAEIQRQYRQRRDAREKYVRDVQTWKRKRAADINCERELWKLRRDWRIRKRNCRSNDRMEIYSQQLTPSAAQSSVEPSGSHESRQRTRGERKLLPTEKFSRWRLNLQK